LGRVGGGAEYGRTVFVISLIDSISNVLLNQSKKNMQEKGEEIKRIKKKTIEHSGTIKQ